jgi:hypothetical protein
LSGRERRSPRSEKYGIPVDHIIKSGDVIGAAVLVVEVIGMFPHVDAEDGSETIRERRVLIGGGDNSESTALFDEPSPTGAEASGGRLGEFIFEGVKGIEGSIDCLGEVTFGAPPALGPITSQKRL